MGLLDDLESFGKDAVSDAEGVLNDAGHAVGHVVDDVAHVAGDGLQALGLDSAAQAVDSFGDHVADDLGDAIAEARLGQSTDPTKLVHGDVNALTGTAQKLATFATAFAETAQGLSAVDTQHWVGQAADAFRAKFDPHTKQWSDARDACAKAGSAMDSYAQTVTWAQGQAQQAIDLYQRGQQASQQAAAAYNQQVDAYNQAAQGYNQAVSAGQSPGAAPTKPGAFSDPGAALRQQALELLDAARAKRDSAAGEAASAVSAATELAPAQPSFGQRLADDFSDTVSGANLGVVHVAGGVVKGVAGIWDQVRSVNPFDPYNITHPAEFVDGLSNTAAGLVHMTLHPTALVRSLVGTGWGSDPFEAFGQLIPNVALAVASDGGGTAAKAGADAAANAARDAGEQAGRDAAGEAADNARPPQDMTCEKDPIDVVSGNMVLPETDVDLPGLVLRRTHISAYRNGRWFGRSWASTVDQRLIVDDQGVLYTAPDGVILFYPHPGVDAPVLPEAGARWPLARCADGGYTITDPRSGQVLHFERQIGGGWPITASADRAGRRITFHYSPDGTPMEIVHDGGHRVRITVADGRVTALHLADVELMRYGYIEGNLTEVVNASGQPLRFEYDHAARIVGWVDRNGSWYRYTYDGNGRCVEVAGIAGVLSARFDYDPDNRTTVMTEPNGAVTRYEYNERLHITAETDPLGHTTRSEVDDFGRVLSRTDPLGRAFRYEYDEIGNLLAVTRPDGTRSLAEYNEQNLPVVLVEPAGGLWRYGYDERGNRTTSTDPAGAVTRYTYDDHGNLAAVTDPLDAVTRVETDAAGLPVAVTDPTGAVTRSVRDGFGRVVEETDPVGGVTRYGWTIDGKPAWRTAPDGATQRWSYDGEGNLIEHTDALGQVTRTEYGHFDRPSASVAADGARLEYRYDAELRLVSVTNPEGLTWRYEYDHAGQLVSEADFNGRTLHYGHDPAGQLIQRVNGAGQAVRYTHDALGNVIEQHAGDEVTRFSYDPVGRLIHASNPNTSLAITRDPCGRILAETCNGNTVTSSYDPAGRRVRRGTPSGVESVWDYDPAGRPTAMHTGEHTLTFSHDAAGREVERRLDTAFELAQTWSPAHQLVSQTLVGGEPRTPDAMRMLQRRQFSYRPDRHLVGVADQLTGARRFDLDPAGRITAVHGSVGMETYGYDRSGNVTQAGWPVADHHAADAPERDPIGGRDYTGTLITRAGTIHYQHDRQGRVVLRQQKRLSSKDWIWRYAWDAHDRLIGVVTPDGAQWRYLYDPLGRRIGKQRIGAGGMVVEQTDFTWDGDTLIEQTHDNAQVMTWDYLPDTFRPVSQTERTAVMGPSAPGQEWFDQRFYAIVTDLVGTPTELVDPAGNLAWHQRTTLWGAALGRLTGRAGTPLRFPGQYHDPETGLYYNYHRYYDPLTARYTTPDPLGQEPNPANPHTYVPNPLTWLDPLGLICEDPAARDPDELDKLARQAQREIGRGTAPSPVLRQVHRIDGPEQSIPGSQWHAQRSGRGAPALNQDGTFRHGDPGFSRKTLDWLRQFGWDV
ncbi:MAG TPA: RHS repeat-associated core domain-containing protein [Pseudonocardiaceae bacterium]|nr:RHS repeat-associated core domain-containing protein [Pseudonocardiaceae bacterium]